MSFFKFNYRSQISLRLGTTLRSLYHGETCEQILHERRDLDGFFEITHRNSVDGKARLDGVSIEGRVWMGEIEAHKLVDQADHTV